MGRPPAPHYWKERQYWVATIHGKPNTRLTEGKCKKNKESEAAAYQRFHQLSGQSAESFVASKDSVAKICELFLEDVAANKSAATHKWFEQRITAFLSGRSHLLMKELRPHHVTKWVNSSPNNSDTTKRNKITAIKKVTKWAKKQGYIESNPLAELEGISAGNRDSYVSVEEYNEIITFIRDDNFRELLTVAFSTGGRPQELLRAEARHFTKDKNGNHIFKFPIKESKGKKRSRIVFLPPDALKIVEKLVEKYPSGVLFRNSAGDAWNPSSCGSQFSRLQIRMGYAKMNAQGITPKSKQTFKQQLNQAAKYQKRFCLYDFRHGFAQAGLKSGVDSVLIGALLGHKDRSMVAKIYSHPDDEPELLVKQLRRIKTTSAK